MTAWMIASGVGVLTTCAVWLCLRARTFDVVLGLTLLSYATNLFIAVMGRVAFDLAPVLRTGVAPTLANYADPLPQALVLTAIVISFAMTALTLVLALRSRFDNGDDACDDGVDPPTRPEMRAGERLSHPDAPPADKAQW
jgi:multicomponent K+:H+ antiporter subunit C